MTKYNTSKKLIKKIGSAIIAMVIARGIGFVRELVIASSFGTTNIGDAFIVAYSIPEILVNGLTAAMAAMYVPMYHKIMNEKENIEEYNSALIAIIIALSIIMIGLSELIPNFVIKLFASGFNTETANITVILYRYIAISILPISLFGIFTSYSQIIEKYALVLLLSVITNVTVIVSLIIDKGNNLIFLGAMVTIGNLLYAIIVFIIIRNKDFRLSKKINISNKYIKYTLIGIGPLIVSSIIEEINQIIDKNFASQLSTGTVSALNYSQKILNLVTAIIGTTICNVLFSQISDLAAKNKYKELTKRIYVITASIMAIVTPFAIIFVLNARFIVRFLFARGNFNNNSVGLTADCLKFYALGVIGFNLKAVWTRVYNASIRTNEIVINSAIAVALNIVFNIIFLPVFKHKGLALATCLASILTDFLLIIKYKKINKYFSSKYMLKEIIKVIICYFPGVLFLIWLYGVMSPTSILANIIMIILSFIILYISGIIFNIILKTDIGNIFLDKLKRNIIFKK